MMHKYIADNQNFNILVPLLYTFAFLLCHYINVHYMY